MSIDVYLDSDKKVFANIGELTVKTDQSVESGGEGKYPEPFDLFFASLGTCSALYVYRFCEERSISTDNIKIKLDYDYDDEKKVLKKIVLNIDLPEDFPKKYKKAVIRAANLCSVKKAISNSPEIVITTD